MELRLMRQEGNWFDANGAFFFKNFIRKSCVQIDVAHVEIRSMKIQIPPARAMAATITTGTLPEWVHEACQLQLTLGNRSAHPIGIWIALVSHGTTSSSTVICAIAQHCHQVKRSHCPNSPLMEKSDKIKTVIAIASIIMPDSELVPWFNALIKDAHPAKDMISRIEKSGSGFLFAQATGVGNELAF